ncbi:MAG TPA: response regulator [candidate division Zixibacteria bacterium]|nr:response regulator [candidate division Zixibacteria bacterium]MDD4916936.1 response regulator [candidate division Zixibacteria bacterium]MDM7973065.1 response regulator [candidate division Zixibacteria bacterium]HOD66817.1 response regulator [candidate division Zixibacteria bacterium]HOZ08976.1 response regulator [candidate division Zixibacteria bacterium]
MNTAKTTILVVDDEPAIRQILLRSLSSAGFDTTTATDGADALLKMAQQPFDIVITDITMPHMDGVALLGEIRSRFPDTKVIFITGQRLALMDKAVREADVDGLISKPFRNHEIVGQLRQLCLCRTHHRAPSDPVPPAPA